MKIIRLVLKYSILIILFIALITSCSKEDNDPDYSYFVSKDLAISYSKTYINNLVDIVSGTIPEVSSLKSFIVSDIDVYRVVYESIIDGEEVKLSGLVCVPKTPGEYPVLSFQNGTNTVNAFSPSEFPLNYSYQLIEILASMGYVVVIADYPGFGESSQLAHPYLVTEPTLRSLIDMLYCVKEITISELADIEIKNEYYLIGYSQGGWATLALHKALELEYKADFNLKGSVCGAGPYNISLLFENMVNVTSYPMPVYLGYILNAYTSYNQFTNPVSDIFNAPYATRLNSLYNGFLSSDEINKQLSTSVSELLVPDFLSGFATSSRYAGIKEALVRNSVSSWHTKIPLLLIHGGSDTHVDPISTTYIYSEMIQSGTSPDICKKVIIPNLDHGDGIAPSMVQGIIFLSDLMNQN